MIKKSEMIRALESHYRSILDRRALDINRLLEKDDSESLDLLIDNIQYYSNALNQFNFVQKLIENLNKSDEDNED